MTTIANMKQVTYSYLSLYIEINFLLLTNCIKFSHLLIKYWLSHVSIFSSLIIMIIPKKVFLIYFTWKMNWIWISKLSLCSFVFSLCYFLSWHWFWYNQPCLFSWIFIFFFNIIIFFFICSNLWLSCNHFKYIFLEM